jgi:predicted phosphodiesterase
MRLIDKIVKCNSRTDTFHIYSLGDLHIGAMNCAEGHIRRLVKKIKDDPKALWVGGGDYINAIKPQDAKRFTPDNLPNWILEGDADTVRKRLKDIVHQEAERFILMVEPIKDKCIGLISGNHEEKVIQYYNEDILEYMCETLDVPNLTRSAGIRINFKYGNLSHVITIFITHGHGAGRSAGAEPNQLEYLAKTMDFDIILRGHSHTFSILAPIPVLSIPTRGKLPKELDVRYKRCANWGCMMMSYKVGPSTYDEKALYPARCLSTLEIEITPLRDCEEYRKISMSELVL